VRYRSRRIPTLRRRTWICLHKPVTVRMAQARAIAPGIVCQAFECFLECLKLLLLCYGEHSLTWRKIQFAPLRNMNISQHCDRLIRPPGPHLVNKYPSCRWLNLATSYQLSDHLMEPWNTINQMQSHNDTNFVSCHGMPWTAVARRHPSSSVRIRACLPPSPCTSAAVKVILHIMAYPHTL